MAKAFQFRRGNSTQISSFTGLSGEIVVDTDKKIAVVHDGNKVGGYELVGVAATQTLTNKNINTVGVITASFFRGDGSQLTGIVGTGSGIEVRDDDSPIGTAATVNFADNIKATINSGIVSVSLNDSVSYTNEYVSGVSTISNLNVGVGGTIITSTSLGLIGIGTTNPTSKLHVVGDVTATTFVGGLTGTATNLNRTVTAGSGLSGGGTLTADVTLNVGAGSGITVNADNVQLKNAGSLTNNIVTKWNSSNEQLTNTIITDNGTNVGIGSTLPNNKLDVIGSTYISGNLGIGTTNPVEELHLYNSQNEGTVFRVENPNTGTAANASVRLFSDTATVTQLAHGSGRVASRFGTVLARFGEISLSSGNGLLVGTQNASPLILGSNDTEALRIDSSQRVGIGTTNLTSKLHVVGDARVTGVITATTFSGTATNSSAVTLASGSGATNYVTFSTTATGSSSLLTDTGLTYNASTNLLGASIISQSSIS
jgi:hypothetical protein